MKNILIQEVQLPHLFCYNCIFLFQIIFIKISCFLTKKHTFFFLKEIIGVIFCHCCWRYETRYRSGLEWEIRKVPEGINTRVLIISFQSYLFYLH